MKKTLLPLLMVMVVVPGFAKHLATLRDVLQPETLVVKGDHFYIIRQCTITRFLLKDYKLLNRFGRRGEGPGEFKYSPNIDVSEKNIFANSVGKISYFTLEGRLLKEIRVPFQSDLLRLKNNFLFHKFNHDKEKKTTNLLVRILDPRLKAIKDIGTISPSFFLYIAPGDKTKRDRSLRRPCRGPNQKEYRTPNIERRMSKGAQ